MCKKKPTNSPNKKSTVAALREALLDKVFGVSGSNKISELRNGARDGTVVLDVTGCPVAGVGLWGAAPLKLPINRFGSLLLARLSPG